MARSERRARKRADMQSMIRKARALRARAVERAMAELDYLFEINTWEVL